MEHNILKSKYFDDIGEVPRSEYPRPQLVRDSYLCLNGEWDFTRMPIGQVQRTYDEKILVPFSPETLLGGLHEPTTKNDKLFYHRTFTLDKEFIRDITLLHFDAVDYNASVYVNGHLLCRHLGGYLPFDVDISSVVKAGENDIRVSVKDPTDECEQARGKQKLEHGKIWYTPQSGIWGCVWLESMSSDCIKNVEITPDIDRGSVHLVIDTSAESADIEVLDCGDVIATESGIDVEIALSEYELWSPENPKLYGLKIKTAGDSVTSYFAMRKFSVEKDAEGISRLCLNNKPYFQSGLLDQGYWSDSLMTPPSDEAMIDDIKLIKAMGFNMLRKHIKIEPLRWYYHCDRLGIIVWQDMVSGGGHYNPAVIMPQAIGIKIRFADHRYKLFARQSAKHREEFIAEVKGTIALLYNSPCVGLWTLFNEGWGQFDSDKIAEMMKELDPTRPIDRTSGWHDQRSGDFISLHIYFTRISCPKDERCFVLSEFGGYSCPVDGHIYSPDHIYGYKKFSDTQELTDAVEALFERSILPNIKKGMSACVYTQLSDVEEEINGVVTFDRKVVKLAPERMRAINERLISELK